MPLARTSSGTRRLGVPLRIRAPTRSSTRYTASCDARTAAVSSAVLDAASVGFRARSADRPARAHVFERLLDVVDELSVRRALAFAVGRVIDRSRVDEHTARVDDEEMRRVRGAIGVARLSGFVEQDRVGQAEAILAGAIRLHAVPLLAFRGGVDAEPDDALRHLPLCKALELPLRVRLVDER